MSRNPYTNACDLIRGAANNTSGAQLSRADASRIRQEIAAALGMDDDLLAVKLSEYYEADKMRILDVSCQSGHSVEVGNA